MSKETYEALIAISIGFLIIIMMIGLWHLIGVRI